MNENNDAASTRADEWLTVSEVAARLKISERTVQRRCKSGQLAAPESRLRKSLALAARSPMTRTRRRARAVGLIGGA